MVVKETWPSYNGIDKDGVGVIVSETGHTSDVKYGRTKLFIRTPKTVFELEKLRAEIVPKLVLFLQKVRRNYQQKIHTIILLFYRVWVAPLLLSLSCVMRKKTPKQKCPPEILPPGFRAVVFFFFFFSQFYIAKWLRSKLEGLFVVYVIYWIVNIFSLSTGGVDLLECAQGDFAPCTSSWTISRDTSGESSCPNFVTHTGENHSNSMLLKHDCIFTLAFSTDKFCGSWKPTAPRIFHQKSRDFTSSLYVCSQFVSSMTP